MDGEVDISYENYIPTDKWSLQDWYLSRLVRLDGLYSTILRGSLSGAVDTRTIISFFSLVLSYHVSARKNMEHHMKDKYGVFRDLLVVEVRELHTEKVHKRVDEIMSLLSDFHWDSGLSKLSESRALGDFARARAKFGPQVKKEVKDE